MQQYSLDKKDVQIIRMLAKDCRKPYRNMALTLGVTVNTVKSRVQRLIVNDIIKFMVNVNFALFHDNLTWCIVIVRCRNPEEINQQLNLLGDVFMQIDCLGGISAFHMIIKNKSDKKIRAFAKTLKGAQVRNKFTTKLISPRITFNQADLNIIKCLIVEPRIKIYDIAKAISLSEKTVRRRLDRMMMHHVLNFTLIPNPAAIRGYIFFGMIISVENYRSRHIIEYIYSKFEELLLLPTPVVRQDVIILVLYTSNFFDIEQILKDVESLKGVKQVEVFHAIRIRNSQVQLMREIDNKLAKFR
jgi:Lrp/AsnC family transcriptional regulator for asnA, asnC and gidA